MNVVVIDSVSQLTPFHHNAIVVCGSHCGVSAAEHAVKFHPFAVICCDAGRGKENAGIAGLAVFDAHLIPAVAVDIWTARIGDGKDVYEWGRLSAVNKTAGALDLTEGMTVKTAVVLLVEPHQRRYLDVAA